MNDSATMQSLNSSNFKHHPVGRPVKLRDGLYSYRDIAIRMVKNPSTSASGWSRDYTVRHDEGKHHFYTLGDAAKYIDENISLKNAKKIGCSKRKCELAVDDKIYDGKILGISELHVVQNLGLEAVIHRKIQLDRIPEQDELVIIKYLGKRGCVEPHNQEKSKSIDR